jgi:DNA-binding transcriptional LysR family regulator
MLSPGRFVRVGDESPAEIGDRHHNGLSLGTRMNLKQIETFLWIVRLGSFAAAAERMNATQATVSIRVQELEHTLGVKLFDRRHRSATLTAKGRELVAMADDLMNLVDSIQSQVGNPQSIGGLVRIGVADAIAMTWLHDLVAAVREAYPKVRLNLEIGMAIDLVNELERGELDLVLAPGEMWAKEFSTIPLGAAEFVWMSSPLLHVPNRPLTPRDLQDWPIITLSERSYHYRIVNQWFKDAHAVCREFVLCNSIAAIASLTRKGLGIGLIPLVAVQEEIAADALRVVTCTPPIPPLKFYALLPEGEMLLARRVAVIAGKVSGFLSSSQATR